MTMYATLQPLMEPREEEVAATFRRLSDLLRDSGREATLKFTVFVDDAPQSFAFELDGRECRERRAVKVPDVEIVTREATWWEIAEGRLSPLEAFRLGRLRILGDTDLATRLFRHVAGPEGAVAICGG